MKKILFILLLTTSLFSSALEEFYKDVNNTYSKSIYKSKGCKKSNRSFLNFETNSTQREMKDDFEKLLPYYISTENIFPSQEIITYFISYFEASTLYIEYLQNIGEHTQAKELMEKNLLNARHLSDKINDSASYMYLLFIYENIYEARFKQEYILKLYKKYPPISSKYFFIMLHNDNKALSKLSLNQEKVNINEQEYMNYYSKQYMKYIDENIKTLKITLESSSKLELEKYKQELDKETKSLINISLWENIKLAINSFLSKIFSIFVGFNIFSEYVADYYARVFSNMLYSQSTALYEKHLKILNNYKKITTSKQNL